MLSGAQRSQYPRLRHQAPTRNKQALRKGSDPWEMQLPTRTEYPQASTKAEDTRSRGVIADFWHIIDVYNREELSKVALSQTFLLSCALKTVKPLIYLNKYKILPLAFNKRERKGYDRLGLYFPLNDALVLPSAEVSHLGLKPIGNPS